MSLVFTNMSWLPDEKRSWVITLVRWPDKNCSAGISCVCPTTDPCYYGAPWYESPAANAESAEFIVTIKHVGKKIEIVATDDGWPPTAEQHYEGTETGNSTFTGTFHDPTKNQTADMVLSSCSTNPKADACDLQTQ